MTVRSRSSVDFTTGTRVQRWDGVTQTNTYTSSNESCEDVVLEGDNHPLTINKSRRKGGLINGNELSNRTGYNWYSWPCTFQVANSWSYTHNSISAPNTDTAYATETLKRTNPSRASVDLGVTIAEMKEIPSLIKDGYALAKDKLPSKWQKASVAGLRKVAKANLIVQFGIMPMIGDAQKLFIFRDLVDQRVRELKRLQERGLRRTVTLWEGENISTRPSELVQSQGVSLRCDLTKTTKMTVRGHVRWRTSSSFPESESELVSRAKSAVLGETVDVSTLYELMPWSWFIDWFSSLGDYISANRNLVGAIPDTPRIMKHTQSIITSKNHTTSNNGQVTLTPFDNTVDSKTRRLVSAGLSAHLPFLDGRQASILGSLAVLKGL
uniref:Maturation protein n=1 Tax=Beihai levi-like virus 11 TaxID=1922396 RepID=A0A1L3KI61_9VIRU|nr:hypothetical protein [Beihai levi-like virus 11]